MIENTENIIQILLTGICTVYSAYRAVLSGRREWILLGLFSGVFFLGDVYYILYLILYSSTPFESFIPYLCWYTSYYFLILLIMFIKFEKRRWKPSATMFLIPVFTAVMCAFFIYEGGDAFSNLLTLCLMTVLLWNSVEGLKNLASDGDSQNPKGKIYVLTIVFCFLEYAMWTASCFWIGDRITNPYFWFDTMLSVCFILYAAQMRKVVDE